jgi:hypothetical protein
MRLDDATSLNPSLHGEHRSEYISVREMRSRPGKFMFGNMFAFVIIA